MKLLAVDTSTKFLCIGVFDGTRRYAFSLEVGKSLSTLITPTISRVLDAAGLALEKIDYFACGIGPGSFTGTRIGVSTIKGLSWATKKPAVGVATLDILAQNAFAFTERPLVPMVDAKRNLVYCSVYAYKNGSLKRLMPYRLLSEAQLIKVIPDNALLLGDAVSLYLEKVLKVKPGVRILDKEYWYPLAHALIERALEKIQTKKCDSAQTLLPMYLYPKECQIKVSK